MARLKAGTRMQSAVSSTQVIVVRAPDAEVDLRCGGQPMQELGGTPTGDAPDPAWAEPTLLGKRYADPEVGIELLCTAAGPGTLAIGDTPLALKAAQPLPASD